MTIPLVNNLNFDGMTKYGNDILLGMAAEIPDLDPNKNNNYINYPL